MNARIDFHADRLQELRQAIAEWLGQHRELAQRAIVTTPVPHQGLGHAWFTASIAYRK
jgi:hypothetical protein